MAILFLDSSALVKRYIAEAGSDWIVDLAAPAARNAIHIRVITCAEVVAPSCAASAAQVAFNVVSADDELNAAAAAEELQVENPNRHL